MSEWKTISIRQELIKEIERIIKTGRYRSISEFVSEAIRLRLEELTARARADTEGFSTEKTQETPSISEKLLYTPKHTWAQPTDDGNIRVGISDYAQKRLKGVAQVRTEPVGRELSKMEPFGVAETWMLLFDLYSPVSGKIVRTNEKLKEKPNIVNEDPYGQGWIAEIKPNNSMTLKQELDTLMGAREYNKWVDKLEERSNEQT